MGRGRGRKPKGPRRVSYQLIERSGTVGRKAYALLDEMLEHHEDVEKARFALAFNRTWKRDADGNITLGKCKKASDLDRELAAFDFVILLQERFWTDPTTKDEQRKALLDHELSHASIKLDPISGEPVEDERGRKVYRLRKHDIEEFSAVVARHGIWKRDLEHFAAALRQSKQSAIPFEQPGAGPNQVQTAQVLAKVAADAGEKKPSELHPFEAVAASGQAAQMCKLCGSGKTDPIHPAPAEAPTVADPASVACSRCGKIVPKATVFYDSGVKPVCETCKRAGIKAGTWPHPFRKNTEKATHCAECLQPEADAVHSLEEGQTFVETSKPGEVGPEESVAVAKARVTGNGNGKAHVATARARKRTSGRGTFRGVGRGKAARP